MASKQLFLPKNGSRRPFCKRWNGNANIAFKNPQMGFEFTTGVYGKCMKNGGNMVSDTGHSCRDYEPSSEASRLL